MGWLLKTTPKERPYRAEKDTTVETLKDLWRKHGWTEPRVSIKVDTLRGKQK